MNDRTEQTWMFWNLSAPADLYGWRPRCSVQANGRTAAVEAFIDQRRLRDGVYRLAVLSPCGDLGIEDVTIVTAPSVTYTHVKAAL